MNLWSKTLFQLPFKYFDILFSRIIAPKTLTIVLEWSIFDNHFDQTFEANNNWLAPLWLAHTSEYCDD